MPPRLPTSCILTARTLLRPFSTTSAVASPRDSPHPVHGTSSNSSLLSLNSNNHSSSGAARGTSSEKRADAAATLMDRFKARAGAYRKEKDAQMDYLKSQRVSSEYLKQMPRKWEAGDVYSPHDLSPVEMQKWRRRTLRQNDVVDALGIRPLDMYKNFSLIENFTSSSGMINHSEMTRLRPVNQRKIAKMIRRVQGMGIYPSIHDHPEMLRNHFYQTRR